MSAETYWLSDWESPNKTSGGHTLFDNEAEARKISNEIKSAHQNVTVSVAPVRLCDENDPELHRYDFDHESYFALITSLEEI